MSEKKRFFKYASCYDPISIGSIDGTDTEAHDQGIVRAINAVYVPNKRVVGDQQRTIFVGRINPRTTEDTVKNHFSKYGKIVRCRLVRDIVTGKSKQYAFVEFESRSCADKAVKDMYKECIDGTEVVVEWEMERTLPGWRPRRLGGGFGGRKGSGQLRFGCRDRPFKEPILIQQNKRKVEDEYKV